MPITKHDAETATSLHDSECRNWRRNGKTQTWKRSPERFRMPVKYGLYNYGQITEVDAEHFHTLHDCPRNVSVAEVLKTWPVRSIQI